MSKKTTYLSPEAIADGKRSGLTKNDMLKLEMHSISKQDMFCKFGIEAEGYVIPYDKDFSRAKILQTRTKFGGELRKYAQAKGTKPQLYFPTLLKGGWKKVLTNTEIPLIITEGEKKAAAACKADLPCVAVGGVWCFRSSNGCLLPDWDTLSLKGRSVYIVYDSDIIDKPQVRYAEYALASELAARGASVMRVRLSHGAHGTKVGLDDFLVANGLPNSIAKAKKVFDELPREEIDAAHPPYLTELGNAIRFELAFKDKLRYVPEIKSWVVFDPTSGLWKQDEDGEAMRCAKQLSYNLKDEAKKFESKEAQKTVKKWAKASQSERNLRATLNLASSEPGLVLRQKDIDANENVLAFPNGQYIDLDTLKISETLPEDFFMKSLGVVYNPKAKCPRWIEFINQVMDGDKERIKYLQRVIGYTLSGSTQEQCFFVLYGMGANGKSTLLNQLLLLFGDYGRQASPQTFMEQRNHSFVRSDLVRLMGVRLVATSEVEGNQRISESLMKQWTGGEEISTRELYQKTFEFKPQGKLFMGTNHKPRIHGTDHAIWRRVHLIPFTRTFSDEEKDTNLPAVLQKELAGILNWALAGYQEWKKKGLQQPSSVIDAVGTYRDDMDVIGAWLKEACIQAEDAKGLIATLFEDYKRWGKDSEEYVFGKRIFVQKMEERGFQKIQTTQTLANRTKQKGRFFKGVALRVNKPNNGSQKFTKS